MTKVTNNVKTTLVGTPINFFFSTEVLSKNGYMTIQFGQFKFRHFKFGQFKFRQLKFRQLKF